MDLSSNSGSFAGLVLDHAQRQIIRAPIGSSAMVIGAPGTGKTTALVERVTQVVQRGLLAADEVLVLTPNRITATALRDRLGLGISSATDGPLARSVSSFAFQVVHGLALSRAEPPPALLTGADQDRIIAELLAGDAEDARAGQDRWPTELGPQIRATRGFRSEVRAFFDECFSLGLDELQVQTLVPSSDPRSPVWGAMASLLGDYSRVMAQMRVGYRNSVQLEAEAANALAGAEAKSLGPFARLAMVCVDDAQELTRSGVALLQALHRRGVAVMAFGDPDISSGVFRGAGPALFAKLAGVLGSVVVLDGAYRQHPELTHLTRTLTQEIGVAGRVEHRRAPGPFPVSGPEADSADGGALQSDPGKSKIPVVQVIRAGSSAQEVDHISAVLRRLRLHQDVGWRRMAVIVHDAQQVQWFAAELAHRQVPTTAMGVQLPLGQEKVVRDIVGVVLLGIAGPPDWEYGAVADAMLSPFGGFDALELRRLRAQLRQQEVAQGGAQSAPDLLLNALQWPAELLLLDSAEGRKAQRFAQMLQSVSAAQKDGATAHELLWLVWHESRNFDGSRLESAWQRSALENPASEYSRWLDGLVALFSAAGRFGERSPHERPETFLRDLLGQDVPEDTLALPQQADTVAVMTPAGALGGEWDAVVIAGVQDEVWPNTRLRGGMLKTWELEPALLARGGGEPEQVVAPRFRRREVLADEIRLFVRAVSRTRLHLVVTAVDDEDMNPSPFFQFLPDPSPLANLDSARYPSTLRGAVAHLRRLLTTSSDEAARHHAASQLAVLARAEVPGAEPDQWYGIKASSVAGPIRDSQARPVRVSPSRIESFETCGLNWAINDLGGGAGNFSAGIGTLLHAAMEEIPGGGLDQVKKLVTDRWGELEFEADWVSEHKYQWAMQLAERLDLYLKRVASEGGIVLGSELAFEIEIAADAQGVVVAGDVRINPQASANQGIQQPPTSADSVVMSTDKSAADLNEPGLLRVTLAGVIDRVELYPPGQGEEVLLPSDGTAVPSVVVVDVKTGLYEKNVLDRHVVEHAQLSAYQLALSEAVIEALVAEASDEIRFETSSTSPRLADARLVVLSKVLKNSHYRIARQHRFDDVGREGFLTRVITAATGMAAEQFVAPVDTHCQTDRYGLCLIHTIPAVSSL